MKNDVWIKSRVTPEFKERFRARAARAGRTESGQLKWLLETHLTTPEERVVAETDDVASVRDPCSVRLRDTNEQIVAGYHALATLLNEQGERNLGGYARMFAERIRYPSTQREREREHVRELERQRERAQSRTGPDLTMLR